MIQNNVTRMLTARGIPFSAYKLPLEKVSAVQAAQILGVDAGQVFKTIVVLREGSRRAILAVLPGPLEVDLKKLALATGEKKVVLATQRQAEQLTGLKAGGISPLALLDRGFDIVIDVLIELYPEIYISGGERGLNLRLPVSDLLTLTHALVADISS